MIMLSDYVGLYNIDIYTNPNCLGDCEDLFALGGGVGAGHQEPSVAEWLLCYLVFLIYRVANEWDFIGD